MKSQPTFLLLRWVIISLVTLVAFDSALAFPPAPDHVITGLIRSEQGDPLSTSKAVVILETAAGLRISASLFAAPSAGINYRLAVPMDSGLTADAYKPTALRPTVPFRLKVQIGATIYLPVQMKGDYSHLGQPAQETRLDLTLGEATTGDEIPDAWKRMIVSMSSGIYTNINQIRAGDHYPGNPMTFLEAYIAGTYPWDPTDGFALKIVELKDDAPAMEFLAIPGRCYTIHASAGLDKWVPVQFKLSTDAANVPRLDYYQATEVKKLRIIVPPQAGVTNCFFKAMVR
jgi:hypothetical protein